MSNKLVDVVSQQHVGSHHCVERCVAHTVVTVADLSGDGFQGLGGGRLTDVDTVLFNQTTHLLQTLWKMKTPCLNFIKQWLKRMKHCYLYWLSDHTSISFSPPLGHPLMSTVHVFPRPRLCALGKKLHSPVRCLEFLDLSPSSRKTKNLLAGYTLQISLKMLRTSRLTLSLASPTWRNTTRFHRLAWRCCIQLAYVVFSFTNLAKHNQILQVSLKMLRTTSLVLSLASSTWRNTTRF